MALALRDALSQQFGYGGSALTFPDLDVRTNLSNRLSELKKQQAKVEEVINILDNNPEIERLLTLLRELQF